MLAVMFLKMLFGIRKVSFQGCVGWCFPSKVSPFWPVLRQYFTPTNFVKINPNISLQSLAHQDHGSTYIYGKSNTWLVLLVPPTHKLDGVATLVRDPFCDNSNPLPIPTFSTHCHCQNLWTNHARETRPSMKWDYGKKTVWSLRTLTVAAIRSKFWI